MNILLVGLTFCALVHVQMTGDAKKDLGNGFGKDFDWVEWPNAVSTALDLDKPIFLLIHKTWCGACQALKKSFDSSSKRNELVELSKKFVMTNTEDDDEPEEDEYAPDGRYIPRLFFLNKYGKPLPVDNKKSYANNAHYFPQVPDVIKAMKLALKLYEEQKESSPDEPVEMPDDENDKKSDEEVKEKTSKKKSSKEKAKKEDDARVVEKPDEDSLGEIHLSEEELSFMETGGCPHAAAARAAAMQSARSEDSAQNENDEKKGDKKVEKKESAKKEKAADTKKTTKDKDSKTKDEKDKKKEKEAPKTTKKDAKSKKTEL